MPRRWALAVQVRHSGRRDPAAQGVTAPFRGRALVPGVMRAIVSLSRVGRFLSKEGGVPMTDSPAALLETP